MNKKIAWLGIVFVVFAVGMRFLPHTPNFVPIGALALFSGVYFSKKWGLIAPLTAMLASDLFIGFYDFKLMAVVYGSFLALVLAGWLVRKNKSFATITAGVLGGSVFFFLTTNFAVWLMSNWYPHTLDGLILSYTLGLPFFRSTLLGNLFYSGIFFGVYAGMPVLKILLVNLFRTARLKVELKK